MVLGVEHCYGEGVIATYQTIANSEYRDGLYGRHTAGANVRREKGNNPDPQLRSQILC